MSARLRRAFGLLLVAALLAGAGCSGLDGAGGASTPTSTVTPAPVPTVAPDDPPAASPVPTSATDRPSIPVPGVRAVAGGVRVNATRLGRAHERALGRAGSYRRAVVLTVRTEDGTVVARDRETVLADTAAGRYLIVETPRLTPGPFDEPDGYERFIANGTRHVYRRYANGTTRVTRSPAPGAPDGPWRVDGRALGGLLARTELTAGSLGDAGAPDRYVLVGRFPDPPTFGLVSHAAGGRLTATVRADGFVRRVRLTYRALSGRRPVAITLSVEYDRLGRTTVARPAWLDDPAAGDSRRGPARSAVRTGQPPTATAAANASRDASTGAPADAGAQSPPSSSRVRRWR